MYDTMAGLKIASPDSDHDAKVEHLEKLKAQAQRGEIILLF